MTRSECKAPVAAIYAPDIPAVALDADGKRGGIFRSSRARAILAIASVALLVLSLLGAGSNDAARNLKDLSDTVMELTRQLQGLGRTEDEGVRTAADLRRQLEEAEIELSWERQHVQDAQETQRLAHEELSKQIMEDHKALDERDRRTHDAGREAQAAHAELFEEKVENEELRRTLARALDELARARSALPPAPGAAAVGEGGERHVLTREDLKKLRGVRASEYQPGDNIEIIEYQEGSKVALRPGIVSDISPDGTYDLVKLEQSVLIQGFRRQDFQSYHVYHEGMPALFEESREVYVPITIVRLLPGSFRPGFELHGTYEFTFDRDEGGEVHEGRAMRMHRFAGIGEIVGTETE